MFSKVAQLQHEKVSFDTGHAALHLNIHTVLSKSQLTICSNVESIPKSLNQSTSITFQFRYDFSTDNMPPMSKKSNPRFPSLPRHEDGRAKVRVRQHPEAKHPLLQDSQNPLPQRRLRRQGFRPTIHEVVGRVQTLRLGPFRQQEGRYTQRRAPKGSKCPGSGLQAARRKGK